MSDITALIPPPLAKDARVVALLTAFERALDHITDAPMVMLDPVTAPESVLPYLAVEHSLDEFVGGDGLPVDVMRDMIARAWDLHEPKGYAAGVTGAIAMLGWPAELTQWWEESPQAARGTHKIDVRVDNPLWPDQPSASLASARAIWRMIHAMQRWSQDHTLRLSVDAPGRLRVGASVATAATITVAPFDPGMISVAARQSIGIGCLSAFVVTVSPDPEVHHFGGSS